MGIESIDSIVSFIRSIIPQLIVSFLGIIGIFITNRLKNADKDKRKNSWRSFLRVHKVVDNCLSDYYKARYPPPNGIMFFLNAVSILLGMMSGLLLSFIIIPIIYGFGADFYKTLFYSSILITSLPTIL
jgi:hypothetical protein